MKLMMALATSTLIVTSAFMQPATAQRKRTGNTYSQMGVDAMNIQGQFTLVDKDKDGNDIKEDPEASEDPDNDDVSFFPKAIENYKRGGFGEACSIFDTEEICTSGSSLLGGYYVDASGFLIIKTPSDTSGIIPFDGDLKAELVEKDPLFITIANPNPPDTIAYSVFKAGETEPVESFRLNFSAFGFDKNLAINDLTYILEQNLFSKAVGVFDNTDGEDFLTGSVLLQNRFEKDITTVPESQTTTGVIALGVLGVLSLLKNKKKHEAKI